MSNVCVCVCARKCVCACANKVITLKQFHLHILSEHTFDDTHYDLEVQFVHTTKDASAQNKVLIVSAFFKVFLIFSCIGLFKCMYAFCKGSLHHEQSLSVAAFVKMSCLFQDVMPHQKLVGEGSWTPVHLFCLICTIISNKTGIFD